MQHGNALPAMLGLVIISLVLSFATRAMRAGTLDRNTSIGIRTRHTLASDDAWMAGHTAALTWTSKAAWTGWASIAIAAVLCVMLQFSLAFAATMLGYLLCFAALAVATKRANAAAKAV